MVGGFNQMWRIFFKVEREGSKLNTVHIYLHGDFLYTYRSIQICTVKRKTTYIRILLGVQRRKKKKNIKQINIITEKAKLYYYDRLMQKI